MAREFIVEADGGSRGNPGPAGYGAVVVDESTGDVVAERAEYVGVTTNNVAEYRGLVAGLRAARELDPEAVVHVRMDSKLVVEQMTGRWKIRHPSMKPLAAEAATVFPPGRVTYEWIPRERNKHADRLANEAMDAGVRGEQWSASRSTAELERASSADRTALLAAAERAAEADGGRAAQEAAREAAGQAAREALRKAAADVRAARNLALGRGEGPGGGSGGGDAPGAGPSAPGTGPSAPAGPIPPAPDGVPVVQTPGWSRPDMGAPATLVLLRHGETPLTPQKRFSGSGGSDPSLSEIGRHQAERAAEALAARGTVQAVVTSPLARTRETARIVAARLGLPVTVDEGLRETDFGAWEGLTFAEVDERHPADLKAWLSDPDVEPTGGGESFATVAARVEETRERLVTEYAGRTVLLVSHVTPIKTFVRQALGAPPESLYRMELSAASLSVVAYYADGNASMRLFNDTSYLR